MAVIIDANIVNTWPVGREKKDNYFQFFNIIIRQKQSIIFSQVENNSQLAVFKSLLQFFLKLQDINIYTNLNVKTHIYIAHITLEII